MNGSIKVKQNLSKVWYSDGVQTNQAEFREWLKGITMTKQKRFEQANQLKETYDQDK